MSDSSTPRGVGWGSLDDIQLVVELVWRVPDSFIHQSSVAGDLVAAGPLFLSMESQSLPL